MRYVRLHPVSRIQQNLVFTSKIYKLVSGLWLLQIMVSIRALQKLFLLSLTQSRRCRELQSGASIILC